MAIRALVVDDDPAIRSMFELQFAIEGFDVALAADGAQAIAAARADRPDVILLDVMMPGMDGFTVVETLRGDPVTAEIPIVMVTAKGGVEAQWAGWQAGVDSYVVKPVDPEALVQEVFRILSPESTAA